MTDHLMVATHEFTSTIGSEIDQPKSLELDHKDVANIYLGVRAVGNLVEAPDIEIPAEPLNVFDDQVLTGGTENMTSNPEGDANAELFKRTYDMAVESIDKALQDTGDERSDKISAILSNIDALLATPYISSAPEFVAMVEGAKSRIEIADSLTTLDSEDKSPAFATLLSQARKQLAGTLIAYRPRR